VTDDARAWKAELVRVADRLEAKTKQARWTDKTDFLIERDFIFGAYALRKVLESHTVSDEIRQLRIPVKCFDPSGTPPDPRHPGGVSESYDFENGRRRTLSVADLCHEIVNNSVFAFYGGESADLFDGVYVSSDRHKEYVYLVLASDFIALCCDVGMENVEGAANLTVSLD
jgi:hypothetical protein